MLADGYKDSLLSEKTGELNNSMALVDDRIIYEITVKLDRVGACLKYFFHTTGMVARGKEKTADCRLLCRWYHY